LICEHFVTNPSAESNASLVDLVRQFWNPAQWGDLNVAIALSGGADSMALTRVALEIKRQAQGEGRLFALHVNHHLRGQESDQDEQWCREQCQLLGIEFLSLQGQGLQHATCEGDGVEAAARNERYQLLAEACERSGVRLLATAHTQDDQVETVLFRLLRGTGLRGLSGISPVRPLTPSVTLIRPLLRISRTTLVDYLRQVGQNFRTDSSNRQLQFSRNRLRNDLLPKLRSEYNRDVDSALLRLADQANQAQGLIEEMASAVLESEIGWRPPDREKLPAELALPVQPLKEHAFPIAMEALRIAWRESGLPEQGMTYDWWHRLVALALDEASSAVLTLPGNISARKQEGWIQVSQMTPGDDSI